MPRHHKGNIGFGGVIGQHLVGVIWLLRSSLLGSDDLDQLPIVDEDDLYPMRKMCRQNLRSKLVDRDHWPVGIMEAAIRRTVIFPERLGMRIVEVRSEEHTSDSSH